LGIASAALMMKKTLLLLKNPWQLLSLSRSSQSKSIPSRPNQIPSQAFNPNAISLQLGNSFHEVLKYELIVHTPSAEPTKGTRGCGLAIYIKMHLKGKEELWKLKHFTMQKCT
jgi:hypothetical protein